MKLLSCVQPTKFLGVQHSWLITCVIPGHTIPGCTATIMQPLHALCTQALSRYGVIWGDFCAHADLLTQPTCTLHKNGWAAGR